MVAFAGNNAAGGFPDHQPEAAQRAQGRRPGGDPAASAEAGPGGRREPVPEPRAGSSDRAVGRAARPINSPLKGPDLDPAADLGGQVGRRAEARSRLRDRRQYRPRRSRPRKLRDRRPRHRREAWPNQHRDRQHALRRLRPAPGLDDLSRNQPVQGGDGGRSQVHQGPDRAERHLCQYRIGGHERHDRDRRLVCGRARRPGKASPPRPDPRPSPPPAPTSPNSSASAGNVAGQPGALSAGSGTTLAVGQTAVAGPAAPPGQGRFAGGRGQHHAGAHHAALRHRALGGQPPRRRPSITRTHSRRRRSRSTWPPASR